MVVTACAFHGARLPKCSERDEVVSSAESPIASPFEQQVNLFVDVIVMSFVAGVPAVNRLCSTSCDFLMPFLSTELRSHVPPLLSREESGLLA